MEPTLSAPLANQDTSFNRHQQYALILVQMGIGETLQIIFALLATLLAQFVRAQAMLSVLPATQGIFCIRELYA